MVNQQTGEFVIFDGTTWWGMGADFFVSLPKTPAKQNFECWEQQKLEASGKDFT